ncbi:MAG: DUF2062 domain-containing protein [Caldiserica bacterium]|nr:DUF2062 domain-containing protein [Caldisericota bacterium]
MKNRLRTILKKLKHEATTRRSPLEIASGIGIGFFIGILPIQGIKTPVTLFIAGICKKVNVVSIFSTSSIISLPPLVPFVYFLDHWVGSKIMGKSLTLTLQSFKNFHYKAIKDILFSLFLGGVTLGIALGVFSFLLSFLILKFIKKQKAITPKS